MHRFWFVSGFNPTYPLEKMIQWWLSHSSFFLIIGDTVALDCLLNGCRMQTFLYCSMFGSHASKTNTASSNEENPPAVSCVASLFGSSVLLPLVSLPLFSGPLILLVTLLHSLNYFHFCCHCYLMTFLSSIRYITTAFMLASGHPGLEIKRLCYWTLYSAQKHHSLWRMHSGHNVHQTCELTYVTGHANICSPLWKLKDHNLKVCV